ncbi:MAG: thiamine pyrophosphate-dependent enzyme, partial [Terracidiphilus sp.]
LAPTDAIGPLPFDLTLCALRGVALKTLLHWRANPTSSVPKVVARANVISPAASAAARLEAALRLAAHFRSTNSGSVVVFFLGLDTPRSKPAASHVLSRERLECSLRQAAARRLPILFVSHSQADTDGLLPVAEQCGVPGMVVDRDDVVAVYRSTSEALTHARRGNGPTLIDSKPWRLNDQRRGPRGSIGKMELYLAGKGLAYRPVKDRISREFAAELERASNAIVRPGKK